MPGKLFRITITLMLLALAFAGVASQQVQAAPKTPDGTINFSEPNGSGDLTGEGEDFFTLNVGDPLDMNNPEDLLVFDANPWSNSLPFPNGGVWNGTTSGQSGSVFLLFPGFNIEAVDLDSHNGRIFKIDPNVYSHLVVKYSASSRGSATASWFPEADPYSQLAGMGNSPIYPVAQGDNILDIDLNRRDGGAGGVAWNARATWSGLTLEPARFETGVRISIDWARLVRANSGPTYTAQWSCQNCSGQTFDLYAGPNQTLAGMVKLASGVNASAGQAAIPVGLLAPGQYYFAAVSTAAATTFSPGKVTIGPDPVLKLTSPSTTSGEDFAASVLNRPWDMNSAASVVSTININNFSVGGGIATGKAINGDPEVFLQNGGAAIDTARFKYLTFDLQVQRPTNTERFTPARVLWAAGQTYLGATDDILNFYDYNHHYTFDMTTVNKSSGAWSGSPNVFRIDPHEAGAGVPPSFRLGAVKLTANQEVRNGNTTRIAWNLLRGDGSVTVFADPSRNFTGTQIGSGIAASSGGFDWTVNVSPGTYWIRAVVNDGQNATQWYSDAPLVVKVAANGFSDVNTSDYWYVPVQELVRRGAISGYSSSPPCPSGEAPCFRPFSETTRAQLAKIVVAAEGFDIDTRGGPHFRDVPTNYAFYGVIETAYNRGLISGYAVGGGVLEYRPGNNVTRAQLSKIIVIAEDWAINTNGGPHFRDVPTNSPFYGVVETAYNHGIISGYDVGGGALEFRPGNSATRAQLSKIIYQAITAP